MIARWELSEIQAEAILNLRLRALRRLEEIEIRKEMDTLSAEEAGLTRLLDSERRQWRAIAKEVRETGAEFGGDSALGRRRTAFAEAPVLGEIPAEALIEREPVTVLCSAKGWMRAVKGHNVPAAEQKYKEGDGAALCGRCRDHRPADRFRDQRALLHDRRRPAAGRPRPGRAVAADGRSAERARHRRDVPLSARHGAAGRGERRARLCRRRRGGGGADPRRQAGADPGRGRGRADLSARRGAATPSPLSATTAGCWWSSSTTSR